MAGAVIGPAVVGITLGIVKQQGFNKQNGLNQAFNHAGNVFGAAVSGYLGLRWGMHAIVLLAALFGVLTILSILCIPAGAIDDKAARGLNQNLKANEQASGLQVLLKCSPLLVLAAALACFHLGNGALLPLYGMAAASKMKENAYTFVALTVIIAQLVMVVASIAGMKVAEKRGYWVILLISFLSLPIRAYIASRMINGVGLYPVQILDGIGAGLQSVAVPGLVAHLLNGAGRINIGQGAVMTIQGAGAALSPAIGGWIAQEMGFSTAFLVLGSFSIISLALWISFAKTLKKHCDPGKDC